MRSPTAFVYAATAWTRFNSERDKRVTTLKEQAVLHPLVVPVAFVVFYTLSD